MLLFSPRWLFFYPGILLMLGGALLGAVLLPGPLQLGRVQLDVHTLMFAAGGILIGFQAVSFAALSKFFAIRSGLRPGEESFETWLGRITLEAGLIAGGLLLAVGILLWAAALWFWRAQGFGSLHPAQTFRWVIPGSLCLALGCQIILSSFFLGVLRLDTRQDPP
jgi:hypothetical protein